MQTLNSILLTLQILSSVLVIVLVLLQQGKGADMGAAFGAGSAGSVFGSAGAANFLSRATKWAAVIFFVTTGGLAWIAHHPAGSPLESGIMSGFQAPAPKQAPVPAPAATGSAVPDVGVRAPAASGNADGNAPAAPAATGGAAAGAAVPQAPAGQGSAVPSVPAGK